MGSRIAEIKQNYSVVNRLFGDIVKVTPSSKVVGDMALFMTANSLTEESVLDETKNHSFPASVIGFFRGDLGIPYGGFPEKLRNIVLKNEDKSEKPLAQILPDVDLDSATQEFYRNYPESDFSDFLSCQMFPKVYEEYFNHKAEFGHVTEIPTPAFFYPLQRRQEILVRLRKGKEILIRLVYVSDADEEGMRTVVFQLNGANRSVKIKDKTAVSTKIANAKVTNPAKEIGAPLQGSLSAVLVKEGDVVEAGEPLFVIEAMKMESTVTATNSGKVRRVVLSPNTMVDQNDLVVEFE